ncbi:GntR family transcriptional regulator [Amycolatopsis acidiphila]|uniref:GntR family transcriptional regulator n=1 Tax=Amycolatopsis acidiphila TaxID=715473 RepID=A0A558AIJ9_9PSEU|nr:GntR family transcriptional regulator [Amycolatopsis acidiphila]TVT24069.1 GntR family transcriptional regulator [Amycolatopsis acidiphila]UIJ57782.1 GntR family transcriptional regulator [Amycolatopsis acidiphila]GHG87671.1 transcriptional regulator [Amycolatopsis acidiphila]
MPVIASVTKTDQIYKALLTQLLEGRHQFGEILSTYELATEFGVSRRPVMDAVMRLAAAGFISIIPQVGCQVTIPDERKVRDHFAVAGILEGAGARLAALTATDSQLAEIREMLVRGNGPAKQNDALAFAGANRDFHSAILAAGGNRRLAELAMDTWDLNDFYLQKNRLSTDLAKAQAEHTEIAKAIEHRDADRAGKLMEQHVSRFWKFVEV